MKKSFSSPENARITNEAANMNRIFKLPIMPYTGKSLPHDLNAYG